MFSGPETSHMRERRHHADGAMTAHAEIADVIEEDHSRSARCIGRLAEERADEHVRAARFIHHSAAKAIIPLAKNFEAPGERTAAQIRAAFDHDSRRLSFGMRINDSDSLHAGDCRFGIFGRFAMPSRMTFRMRLRSSPFNGRRGARTHSLPRPHSCTANLMYCTNFI